VRGKQYPLVVTGDSFVMPYAEPSWVKLLGHLAGSSTLNLGMDGWGPQSEAAALGLYGFSARPRWVILAYFEGNDLINAAEYERRRASGLSWLEYDQARVNHSGLVVLPVLFRYLWAKGQRFFRPLAAYRYPLTLELNAREVPIAFFDGHLTMLTASAEDIRRSRNFALVREALLHVKGQCDRAGARFLIVNIPSKERVYLPLVVRSGKLGSILPGTRTACLASDGRFGPGGEEVAPNSLAHLDDQATVIARLAETHGIDFLDLLPSFREQADRGTELYYYADIHWAEEGQRLAAAVVASHLARLERQARRRRRLSCIRHRALLRGR